jgi:type VI secretion system secreted protein VgrG
VFGRVGFFCLQEAFTSIWPQTLDADRSSEMRCKALIPLVITAFAVLPLQATADTIALGTAANFAVLAGSTVTNTGLTVISGGNVGVSPGTSITGFASVDMGPGTITPPYTAYSGGPVPLQAEQDLTTAYNNAAGLAPTQVLTGQDLGGLTLTPGVYFFMSSAQLTGQLTLNDEGNPNAQFVFQIGSTLTTAPTSSVVTIGSAVPDANVFWQVGSSATLNAGSAFEGNILAYASITLDSGATIADGRALAQNGAVTLISNIITVSSVPEPTTLTLALIGGAVLGLPFLRRRLIRRR